MSQLKNVQIRAGMLPGFGNEIVGTFQGPGQYREQHEISFNRVIMAEYLVFQKMELGQLGLFGIVVGTYIQGELDELCFVV